MIGIQRPTERTMLVYSESVEAFKTRRFESEPRLDLEEVAGLGNRVFESILDLDLNWSEMQHSAGEFECSSTVPRLYRGWAAATRDLLEVLARAEGRGMAVRGAESLRSNLDIVGEIIESQQPVMTDYDPRMNETAEFAA